MATLDLHGSKVTLPDSTFFGGKSFLNGSDNVTNTGTTAAILTESGGTGGVYSGTVSDGLSTVAITQTSGTIDITGSNSYSGGTNLQGGTIEVGNSSALGATTGTLAMANGTTLQSGAAGLFIENPIQLAGTDTIDNNGNAFILTGNISGTGLLSAFGIGMLTLSGNNNYTGGTDLFGGTLAVDSNTALGSNTLFMGGATTLQAGAGSLALSNAILLAGTNTIDNNGNNLTLSGVISGIGPARHDWQRNADALGHQHLPGRHPCQCRHPEARQCRGARQHVERARCQWRHHRPRRLLGQPRGR